MQLLLHLQGGVEAACGACTHRTAAGAHDPFGCLWRSHAPHKGQQRCGAELRDCWHGWCGGQHKAATLAGHSQPNHQMGAVNSSLATHPVGFALAWDSTGGSLWKALAPTGYVALCCVASLADAAGGRSLAPGEAGGPVSHHSSCAWC
uniref:Uncharacterized protein n=1 Tax=Tetradesmus obliquus TaxID=3088 RepID=A0A383VRH0_TETOB|eukprot:jgi/Sobl393_1/692/SZX67372.1